MFSTGVNHADLQQFIVDYLVKQGAWNRAVSLDIEADLKTLDEPGKPILSVSVSRRVPKGVETTNMILEEETRLGELELVKKLANFCMEVRPLVIIGYNINRFDLLVLSLKIRQLDVLFQQTRQYSAAYWAMRETLGRSYFLDLIDPVRFEVAGMDGTSPRMISLEEALQHRRFANLPLLRTKHVLSEARAKTNLDVWEAIRHLWKNDRKQFESYISGDSHDTLLLAEDLFEVGKSA